MASSVTAKRASPPVEQGPVPARKDPMFAPSMTYGIRTA